MGPALNPLYWLAGVVVLVVASLVAVAIGFVVYASVRLLTRRAKGKAQSVGWPIAIVVALVCFVLTFSVLCHWSFVGSPFSTDKTPENEPVSENIVGVWSPFPSSLEWMEAEGGYEVSTHTLSFDEGGMFTMTNMPDCWLNPSGESTGGFYSGSGYWKTAQIEGNWVVEVRLISLPGYGGELTKHFELVGRRPPYFILIVCDSDSPEGLWFSKKPASTK